MRLSSSQIVAIRQNAGKFYGVAQVRLSGGPEENKQGGFTLIELIMTMIIVGILAVVVAPRFFARNVFQERGAANQVQASLRYAQKVAIAQRRNVSVTVSSAAVSDCGTALVGGNINCVISNSVTVAPALPLTVTFNALGQPGAAVSVTVGTITINVEAETGYVHSP